MPTPTPEPRPTKTPPPRGVIPPAEPPPTITPTDTPVDLQEPNDTPAQASELGPIGVEAFINGPNDVDVYRIEVPERNTLLVVTLTGQHANRYKVDLVAPRRGNVGRQRLDGTVAVRALADVGVDTGTYYVYVRGTGADFPQVPYTLSAEIQLVSTPTGTN